MSKSPFQDFSIAIPKILDYRYRVIPNSSKIIWLYCIDTNYPLHILEESIFDETLFLTEKLAVINDNRVYQYTEILLSQLFNAYGSIRKEALYYEEGTEIKSFLRKALTVYYEAVINILAIIGRFEISFRKSFITHERHRGVYKDFIETMEYYNLKNPQATNEIISKGKSDAMQYSYDMGDISQFYVFCNKDVFDILPEIFADAISSADFKHIYKLESTKKCKLLYLIYIIKDYVQGDDWYKKAAESISCTPSRCSGANVPDKWKEEINAIK